MEPYPVYGDVAVDDRGQIGIVNGFDVGRARRFFILSNHRSGFVRAGRFAEDESDLRRRAPPLALVVVRADPHGVVGEGGRRLRLVGPGWLPRLPDRCRDVGRVLRLDEDRRDSVDEDDTLRPTLDRPLDDRVVLRASRSFAPGFPVSIRPTGSPRASPPRGDATATPAVGGRWQARSANARSGELSSAMGRDASPRAPDGAWGLRPAMAAHPPRRHDFAGVVALRRRLAGGDRPTVNRGVPGAPDPGEYGPFDGRLTNSGHRAPAKRTQGERILFCGGGGGQ